MLYVIGAEETKNLSAFKFGGLKKLRYQCDTEASIGKRSLKPNFFRPTIKIADRFAVPRSILIYFIYGSFILLIYSGYTYFLGSVSCLIYSGMKSIKLLRLIKTLALFVCHCQLFVQKFPWDIYSHTFERYFWTKRKM